MAISAEKLEKEIRSLPDIEKLRLVDVILTTWTNLIPNWIGSGPRKLGKGGIDTNQA
jgi:hypothetical protein